jgi:hypothetical protein
MNLQALPEDALKEILALTEAKKRLDTREAAHDYFMPFAHHVYENFIEGQSSPCYLRRSWSCVARGAS